MKTFILSLLVLLSINAMSQLVVSTNIPCKLNLDFTEEYKLIPYYKKKISLTNGEHYIQAKSIDGGLSWDTVINVVNNKTVELQIDLHKVIPIVANILFISNENCTLNVNQDTTITLETDIGLKLNLPEGEYIINAFNTIGNEWQSTLNIVDNTQKVIKINFNNYDNTESIETYKQPTKQKQESSKYGSFTDPRDGKTYKTVKIGSQIWMAENLNYYTNSGSYCYDDKISNCEKYGRLYDWKTAKKVCPAGWHLPSDDEWKELEMALGMSQAEADDEFWRGTNEGSKLAGNTILWLGGSLQNDAEFGTSGFTALPGGSHAPLPLSDGTPGYIGFSFYNEGNGIYWSATEDGTDYAWTRYMVCYDSRVFRNGFEKESGFSVRCLRD
jgi:uncharacterized protein (TIGR02145 family)